MRLACYQPQYLPRLHYINRALDSDVFVLLDSTKFTRRLRHHGPGGATTHPSHQAHAPIRLADGYHLLTLPVRHQGRHTTIAEAQVAARREWARQHLRTIHGGYATAPEYDRRQPELQGLLDRDHDDLATLNIATLLWALDVLLELDLGVEGAATLDALNERLAAQDRVRLRRVVRSSQLAAERPDGRQQGNAWIVAMCHELGADEHLCGGTAMANYIDKEIFTANGVEPVLQTWHCRPYRQQFCDRHPFMPNLSVIDLVCNIDAAAGRAVVWPE